MDPAAAPARAAPSEAISWGALLAGLSAICYALSIQGLGGARGGQLGLVALVAMVVLLPFVAFGVYTARRWVGLEPAPLLGRAFGRAELPPRAELVPMVAVGTAFVCVAGSIPLSILLMPAMEAPEEHPFAGLSGGDLLLANLLVAVEEVVFRVAVLFPLLALFGVRAASRDGRPPVGAWAAFAVSGALFGLAHAPDATLLGAPLGAYAVFALVQKGLFIGTILGYVAWRWGFEASVLAHYATNVLLLLIATLAT